jgi:FKBP-type peptidyl-prolyl cis-trans isomerase
MKIVDSICYTFLILLVFSCNKQQKDAENVLLEQYFNDKGITDEQKESYKVEDGLYLIKSGFSSPESLSSPELSAGDTLILFYKGYLLSDENVVFEETDFITPEVYVYLVDQVISGWEKTIPLMKKDEVATFIIRSEHAYKGEQIGLIPPYSTLIFEVRIVEIIQK